MHPPTDQIYELWQIFADNVDPLTNIVHVPSLRLALDKATTGIPGIPRSFNALMFAIYSTAVLSLDETDCQVRFAQSRSSLLSRYVATTKAALARADVITSSNIVVLQALSLHILSIRDTHSPRSIWTLTGMAIRIAEGIGLHRNINPVRIGPFKAETWRRLWCYIKMQDNRTAEMCGLPTFRGVDADMDMPRPLANINDEDIDPHMQAPPSELAKATDMIFCAVQSEFFVFAGRMAAMNRKRGGLNFVADVFASKDSIMPDEEAIQSMEDHIETKFLRYCDASDPLHLTTILFARYCMNVCRFMARHPRKWENGAQMPEGERKSVWNIGIKLLEQLDMIQSSPHLQRFAWNFGHYLQWSAFVYILDTLRVNPLLPDAAKAWRLVEATFRNNSTMTTDTTRPLYVAVGNLCLKAFSAREKAAREKTQRCRSQISSTSFATTEKRRRSGCKPGPPCVKDRKCLHPEAIQRESHLVLSWVYLIPITTIPTWASLRAIYCHSRRLPIKDILILTRMAAHIGEWMTSTQSSPVRQPAYGRPPQTSC